MKKLFLSAGVLVLSAGLIACQSPASSTRDWGRSNEVRAKDKDTETKGEANRHSESRSTPGVNSSKSSSRTGQSRTK